MQIGPLVNVPGAYLLDVYIYKGVCAFTCVCVCVCVTLMVFDALNTAMCLTHNKTSTMTCNAV